MQPDYREFLALCKKGDACKWDLGDLLLKRFGRKNEPLTALSLWLRQKGYDAYKPSYLEDIRDTSAKFPKQDRRAVTWDAHKRAMSLKTLDAAIKKAAEEGREVSQRFVTSVRKDMTRAKHKAAAAEAEEAAEKARAQIATARTEEARKAAEEREAAATAEAVKAAKKAKGPPTKNGKPTKDGTPFEIFREQLGVHVGDIRASVHHLKKMLDDPQIDGLSNVTITAEVDFLIEAQNEIALIVKRLRRNQSNIRGHIQVVA